MERAAVSHYDSQSRGRTLDTSVILQCCNCSSFAAAWALLIDVQHWIARRQNCFFGLASNQALVQSGFSSVTPCRSVWQWSCCIIFCRCSAVVCLMGLRFQEIFCETCFPSWFSALQNISYINTVHSVVYHHHRHHVLEGLGVFPVPWSSRWSWSLQLFLGRPMFLRPFGLYCSARFGSLFVSILCTCCSHFW